MFAKIPIPRSSGAVGGRALLFARPLPEGSTEPSFESRNRSREPNITIIMVAGADKKPPPKIRVGNRPAKASTRLVACPSTLTRRNIRNTTAVSVPYSYATLLLGHDTTLPVFGVLPGPLLLIR